MFKKILALAAAAALALTLAACGGTGEQLPTLVLEDPSASNMASDVSGVEKRRPAHCGRGARHGVPRYLRRSVRFPHRQQGLWRGSPPRWPTRP